MANKLCYVKLWYPNTEQMALFYPHNFSGGEIVLCVQERFGFAKVFYCGELFTVAKEYLAIWIP
jgi:hypothetical protein